MVPDLARLWKDLPRRRVIRVAVIYLVAGWAVIEVSSTVFPLMSLPAWAPSLVVALVGVGLPIALGLAWAYDVGPEGITRTPPEPRAAPGTPATDGPPSRHPRRRRGPRV
jgi:hypothetical protein